MRRISDHRIEESGFNESVQGLVRNSPWWMVSLAVHGVALIALWNIPFQIKPVDQHTNLVSTLPPQELLPEDTPPDEPEPTVPDDTLIEEVLLDPADDEHNQDDADSEFTETLGEEGDTEGVLTGPTQRFAVSDSLEHEVELEVGGGGREFNEIPIIGAHH